MDVNGVRTLDIKRIKFSSEEEKEKSEDAGDLVDDKKDSNGKGDISLVHKALEDSPYVLDGDPSFGLFITAKRDLKAGEVLYDDTPAFLGPSADLIQDYDTPLCLGCCIVMNDGNGENRCPDCNWPICGPDCDNLEHHKANECDLFVKHKVKFPPNVEIQPCYKAIAIIRGLLIKDRSPKMWEQLMTLQWETQLKLTPDPDFEEIKENFGLSDFGDEEDWQRILGIINVNSYSFQRVEKKDGSPSFGECLFPIYSLMCHSCTPNCTWAIIYSPTFTNEFNIFLGMLRHYLARGWYRKIQLLREDGSEDDGKLKQDMLNLQDIQQRALKFCKENPHYDSLTANYKREPDLLEREAEDIKKTCL